MSTLKDDVAEMIHHFPENTTFEDIQYHIYVLEKIRKGQKSIKYVGECAWSLCENEFDNKVMFEIGKLFTLFEIAPVNRAVLEKATKSNFDKEWGRTLKQKENKIVLNYS